MGAKGMGEKWGLGLLTAGGCLGVTWFNRWLFFRTVSACVQSQPPLRIRKREHWTELQGRSPPAPHQLRKEEHCTHSSLELGWKPGATVYPLAP